MLEIKSQHLTWGGPMILVDVDQFTCMNTDMSYYEIKNIEIEYVAGYIYVFCIKDTQIDRNVTMLGDSIPSKKMLVYYL